MVASDFFEETNEVRPALIKPNPVKISLTKRLEPNTFEEATVEALSVSPCGSSASLDTLPYKQESEEYCEFKTSSPLPKVENTGLLPDTLSTVNSQTRKFGRIYCKDLRELVQDDSSTVA